MPRYRIRIDAEAWVCKVVEVEAESYSVAAQLALANHDAPWQVKDTQNETVEGGEMASK